MEMFRYYGNIKAAKIQYWLLNNVWPYCVALTFRPILYDIFILYAGTDSGRGEGYRA